MMRSISFIISVKVKDQTSKMNKQMTIVSAASEPFLFSVLCIQKTSVPYLFELLVLTFIHPLTKAKRKIF